MEKKGVFMIKAVLFDLDGTLVNSIEDLADAANYGLSMLNFPTHETEKYKYFVGNGMPDLIRRVLPEDKRDSDTHSKLFDIFVKRYQEHFFDKTRAYDGIEELLTELRKMGMKLAVISNKAEAFTLQVVDKALGDKFDEVYGKREGYPTKPDPRLTLELMKKLGVSPEECVLVGDSGMDMAASVNAGCIGIGALWGFRTKEELQSNGAVYVAQKPMQVIEIIKEINR